MIFLNSDLFPCRPRRCRKTHFSEQQHNTNKDMSHKQTALPSTKTLVKAFSQATKRAAPSAPPAAKKTDKPERCDTPSLVASKRPARDDSSDDDDSSDATRTPPRTAKRAPPSPVDLVVFAPDTPSSPLSLDTSDSDRQFRADCDSSAASSESDSSDEFVASSDSSDGSSGGSFFKTGNDTSDSDNGDTGKLLPGSIAPPRMLMMVMVDFKNHPHVRFVPRDPGFFPERFDQLYGKIKQVQSMRDVRWGLNRSLVHPDWVAAVTMLLWQPPSDGSPDPVWGLDRARLRERLETPANWDVEDKVAGYSCFQPDATAGFMPAHSGCWCVEVRL
jgi:hypothetical protein